MDEKEFFHQGTIRICGTLDEKKMLDDCLGFLKSHIPVEGLMICLYDTNSGVVEVIAFSTQGRFEFNVVSFRLSKYEMDFAESTIGKVLILDKLVDNPVGKRMKTLFNLPDLSAIVLRLKIENQRIGSIIGFSRGEKQFSKRHGEILEILHDPFAIAISNISRVKELHRLQDHLKDDNYYFQEELRKIHGDELIGSDSGLKDVVEMIAQVAPLESKVLIMGETGVGKELIASSIHYSSKRSGKPFIKLNCGAIPDSLIDSELFGHEKGAFTGALSRRRGRFERAEGGTLFLDEIGELPLNVQTRLLRVLERGEYERVGGCESIRADVRIIAATNRNLETLVKQGVFREDLWFRLNVFPIIIPPLRQRKGDIPALIEYFINKKINELKLLTKPLLDADALFRLISYNWPGNVRELENSVERELIRTQAKKNQNLEFLDFGDLKKTFSNSGEDFLHGGVKSDGDETINGVLKFHIESTLKRTRGRIQGKGGAADVLGVHPSTLRHKMKKLNIDFGRGVLWCK